MRPPTDDDLIGAQTLAQVEAAMFGSDVEPPLGRYQVGPRAGVGGMGAVHRAWDPLLERTAAIKILRHDGVQHNARLRREAMAMAAITHRNVVKIFELGDADGTPYLVMEWVDGPTLGQWLTERDRPWREVLRVLLETAQGVMAVHAAGLLHRDLKPSNVLVDSEGRARVTDFGLTHVSALPAVEQSEPTQGGAPEPITEVGCVMGTPLYMPAEQRLGGTLSPKTDQWALAMTMWEALYGARPEGFAAHHIPWNEAPGNKPKALQRVLARALSVSPDDRFASVPALVAALRRASRPPRLRLLLGAAIPLGLAAAVGATITGPPPPASGAAAVIQPATRAVVGKSAALSEGKQRAASSEPRTAVEPLQRAFFEAVASDDSEAAAEAASLLSDLFIVEMFDAPSARHWDQACLLQIERGELGALWTARREATLAKILHAEADYEGSTEVARQALARLDEDQASGPKAASLRESLLTNLALLAIATDNPPAAVEYSERAHATAVARGAPPIRTLRLKLNHMQFQVEQSEADADALLALVEEIEREVGSGPLLEQALFVAGTTQSEHGRYAQAIEIYERVLADRESSANVEDELSARVHASLGVALSRVGRTEAAVSHLTRSVREHERLRGANHPDTALVVTWLASVHADDGALDRAEAGYIRALDALVPVLGDASELVTDIRVPLGKLYLRKGDVTRGATQLRNALAHLDPKTEPGISARIELWALGERSPVAWASIEADITALGEPPRFAERLAELRPGDQRGR